MICIEHDPNNHGDRFIARIKDAGMGRGATVKGLTLEAALEAVKHYFAVGIHNAAICGFCVDHKAHVTIGKGV